MNDILKDKELSTDFGTVSVKRKTGAMPALTGFRQANRRMYDAYERMGAQMGWGHEATKIADSLYQRDAQEDALAQQYVAQQANLARSVQKDAAMTLPNSSVGYRTRITRSRSNFRASNNDHLNAFGLDNSGLDPRVKKVRRLEMEVLGRAARYCCGTKGTTAAMNLKAHETGRAWYSIEFEYCWTQRWEDSYLELFDYEQQMMALCEDLLYQTHAEVTWFGDEISGIRGLKQLPVERIYLPTPFDQLAGATSYQDAYDYLRTILNYQELRYGNTGGYRKTNILLPSGFGHVLSMKNFGSAGCCDTLGEDFNTLRENRKAMNTDWMNSVGEKNTPAMFLYARDPNAIWVDHSVAPTWLPPVYDCGMIRRQCVMRLGEMATSDVTSGLLVSNVLTAPC